jgi:putative ABC transport system permease protein
MKILDIFSYSLGAIRLRKLRAALTILGVVIGIAAIISLLSISQGLQNSITSQLQTGFATDTLIVSAGGGFGLGPRAPGDSGSGFSLLINDTQTINNIQHVNSSLAIIQRACYIQAGENEALLNVVGVDFEEFLNIYSSTFVAETGDIPADPTDDTIIVGKRINDPWENGTIPVAVNDSVEIFWTNGTSRPPRNETYVGQVQAVLVEIGGLNVGGPTDSGVYIPISKAQSFFGTDICNSIVVKLENDDPQTIEKVSEDIRNAFSDQVSVTSSTAIRTILSNVTSTIEVFLIGVAAISLIVAGVGIMNIMLVSLLERTREIGILKALGMKGRTVLSIFLSEAAIIGILGGSIGVLVGWILSNIVSRFLTGGAGLGLGSQAISAGSLSITPVITLPVLMGAVGFGVLIAIVFAIYPSWRASKLKPVDALRYE